MIEVSAKQEVITDLPVMADYRMDAIINAPCESIDLTAWALGLTDMDDSSIDARTPGLGAVLRLP